MLCLLMVTLALALQYGAASQLVLQAAADVNKPSTSESGSSLGHQHTAMNRNNARSNSNNNNGPPFEPPDWTTYHTGSQILARLRQLDQSCDQLAYNSVRFSRKAPETAHANENSQQMEADGSSVETAAVLLTSGAKQSIFQRIARELAFHRKTRVMAVFGEHGRELIGPEVALFLAETVCKQQDQKWIDTLSDVELVLIPLANAHGREQVERGVDYCARLNGNGVDLNRNFPFHWGERDETTLLEEEPAGPMPLSEPEARAIDHFARQFRPHLYLSVHSGDQAIILPYDSTRSPPPFDRVQRLRAVAERVLSSISTTPSSSSSSKKQGPVAAAPADKRAAAGSGFVTGSAGNVFGYLAYGTAVDYMFEVLRVPFVYTVELFGELRAHNDDCVRMFNPRSLSSSVPSLPSNTVPNTVHNSLPITVSNTVSNTVYGIAHGGDIVGQDGSARAKQEQNEDVSKSYEAVVRRGAELVREFAVAVSERLGLERLEGSSFLESDELLPEEDDGEGLNANGDGAMPMLVSADLRRAGLARTVMSEVVSEVEHTWSQMGMMSLAAAFLGVFCGVAVFTRRYVIIHERIDNKRK